jgi:uncharacterized protein (TIGR02453 family)
MNSAVNFLKKLKKNNNKPWFDTNRNAYTEAKQEVETFLEGLIAAYGKTDDSIAKLSPKECMFRINRDVRFSKDKSPYKINFGASINPGGKKSGLAGYYLHIEPGQSFAGGGLWMPMPPDLSKIRQEIDYNLREFTSIIKSPAFKKQYGELYTGEEMSLVRVPKGYEADNPAAPWLKLKSFIAMRKLSDEDLNAKSLQKTCVAAFTALKPLVEFINRTQMS